MATFKSKMKHLADDWADKIWQNAREMNNGKGADWLTAIAVLAITGARPAQLERGISFQFVRTDDGKLYLEATIPGAKIIKNPDGTPHRGQDLVKMNWQISPVQEIPPRSKEYRFIYNMMLKDPDGSLVFDCKANSLSVQMRALSKQIWPRRTKHVSPICYRELLAQNAKDAGIPADQLAMAMAHLSAESQGKYASRSRKARGGGVKPAKVFSNVAASHKVKKMHRSPQNSMARFKAANSLKTKLKQKSALRPNK